MTFADMVRTSLADVFRRVVDPQRYTAELYNNMATFKEQHGTAIVRIGIKGKLKYPNYSIGTLGSKKGLEAYSGRTHKRLNLQTEDMIPFNWSDLHMTIDDLEVHLPDFAH